MMPRYVIVAAPGRFVQLRPKLEEEANMARWPRTAWTTLFTYGAIFLLFPLLCWLAYLWVQGRLF